jgi:hypothetical protein
MMAAAPERLLVLACGALAREVLAVARANRWEHVDVHCLPAKLHVTPDRIPAAVDEALAQRIGRYDRAFIAYADCGTAGALDRVIERHGAERLPGAHCYAAYAGLHEWEAMHDEEPGTYYLTDFLVRHFHSLVVRPLGLDRHPELREDYFGNYRRVLYLSQAADPAMMDAARACADRIGLPFAHRATGYGLLGRSLAAFAETRRVA